MTQSFGELAREAEAWSRREACRGESDETEDVGSGAAALRDQGADAVVVSCGS